MNIQNSPKVLNKKLRMIFYLSRRGISKYIHKDISSKVIRQNFLDYFLRKKEHAFVKSSPVVPFCDPTVPFVNAGMNQFKGIFLGTQSPHFTKVANSQKCIRVGGKHNDLSIVGKDGYHHTFFEMLGNWSFGDYFKVDACQMAWELLTQVYRIPHSRLYVTYFGGDESLGISSDVETKEIWKSIGVEEDRILPFGKEDNFWEMGLTGPCGPCTEIHFDHIGDVNRSQFVNKNLPDLTEIWNLVFIEYNRLSDNSLSILPKKHIDTGLGLERLSCALQGKLSTYDTDLFDYLLNAIHKNCSNIPKYSGRYGEQDWNDIDSSYRILSDHMRMITVSLADGAIPEQNQKLRRILRKCFILAEKVFLKERGLIKELSNYVVDNLGDVYPELERNVKQIHQIIDFEEDIYNTIRKNAEKEWKKLTIQNKFSQNVDLIEITPGFVGAFKELVNSKPKEIDGDLSFKLYDTHGLDVDSIEQISQLLKIDFYPAVFTQKMNEIKFKSKVHQQNTTETVISDLLSNLDKTDDSEKYLYSRGSSGYVFPKTECKVLRIVENDKLVTTATEGHSYSLIFDKTNLYSEAGGQMSDKGTITFKNGAIFNVESLSNINDIIIHNGYLEKKGLQIGSEGIVSVDEELRLNNMRNHTCTHLLNGAVKKIKKATCQKSTKVTDIFLNFDVAIFGNKLNNGDIQKIEDIIIKLISDKVPVRVDTTDSQGLYSYDTITLIPGEIYPEYNIRIIEVINGDYFISREPCCGTHVLNTEDIEDFTIISVKSLRRSTASIFSVTGERAKLARKNADDLQEDINIFEKSIEEHLDKPDMLEMGLSSFRKRLNFEISDRSIVPYVFKQKTLESLEKLSKRIKEKSNDSLKSFVEMEMDDALKSKIELTKSNKKFMIHYIRSSMMLESVSFQRAIDLCKDMPVILIAYSDSTVKARCCVPKEFQNEEFNAETWLKQIAEVFKTSIIPSKNPKEGSMCDMKPKKIHVQEWHNLLSSSIEKARLFINKRL